MNDFWSEKYALVDLLFETNLSLVEIAKELDVTQSYLSKEIRDLGLHWIKKKGKKMSRGQSSLTAILQKIFPNEQIINEYHVGEQLRLDIYCPAYKLGIEFHGRQHYDHVARFHDTWEDFRRAQERDERKLKLCYEQGITVVVFKYCDELTEDAVYQRVLGALQEEIPSTPVRHTREKYGKRVLKGNPMYEEMKARKREFGKQVRAKMKEDRKKRGEFF